MSNSTNVEKLAKVIKIRPEPDANGVLHGFVVLLPGDQVACDVYQQRPIFLSTRGAAERLAEKLPTWIMAYAICPAKMREKSVGVKNLEVDNSGAEWKERRVIT